MDRPRPQHDLPRESMTPQLTWDEYFAMHFATDEGGRPYCILCGSYVREGWQVDHVDRLHALRIGM